MKYCSECGQRLLPILDDKHTCQEVLWSSSITADMVVELTEDELGELINELDDMVARTCEDWGMMG